MMKDEINLLPPAIKQLRVRKLYVGRAGGLLNRLIVGLLFFAVTLAAIYAVMKYQQNVVTTQTGLGQAKAVDVSSQVRQINTVLKQYQAVVDGHPPVTERLASLMAAMPAQIHMRNLKLQGDDGALVVRVVSASPTAVLDFQKKVEALPWVERVEAPLQNFATGPDKDYSFTIIPKPPET